MKRNPVKAILIALFLLIYIDATSAQDTLPSLSSKPRRPDNFWHRVSVGGNLGFQFGTVTGITVAPEISLRTVDNLYVGLRLVYQYYKYNNYYYDYSINDYIDFSSSTYGGSIYLRYYLNSLFNNFLGNLFAHVEYEYLRYTRPFEQCGAPPDGYITDGSYWYRPGNQVVEINSIFVGGGYRQPLASRVSLDFMVLFNLNDTYNSPYSNPVFRLGVGVGL